MTQVLSFPFRLAPNGTATTVPQDTYDYYTEQISVLMLTHEGERVFDPDFGVPMMEFDGFSERALAQSCLRYLPEVEITGSEIVNESDETQGVVVQYEITGASNG